MDKVFIGSVKEITNDYGTMFSLGIKKEDIDKLEFNEDGRANLSLKKSQKGNWYMEKYTPKPKQENDVLPDNDLPFN